MLARGPGGPRVLAEIRSSPSRVTPGARSQQRRRGTGGVSLSVIRAVSPGAQPSNSSTARAVTVAASVGSTPASHDSLARREREQRPGADRPAVAVHTQSAACPRSVLRGSALRNMPVGVLILWG